MNNTQTVSVNLSQHTYDIYIGGSLLPAAAILIKKACHNVRKVIVISDQDLPPQYLLALQDSLQKEGISQTSFFCQAGDSQKNFSTYQQLANDILASGVDRQTVLIALGGGVIGDMGGFLAGTLLRGIRFVQIPTTLLSQVDSSVGGKTGINTPAGKNLLGVFWQPHLVLIDTGLLQTLPHRELMAGYAEILKYGLINDRPFFDWLENSGADVLKQKPDVLQQAITTSCQNKANVVAEDEREKGQRALLNLGHTFGHAIENILNYDNRMLHGEAVAIGCLMAFRLSVMLGYCDEADYQLVRKHQERLGYPVTLPTFTNWSVDTLLAAMYKDKKADHNALNLVLVKGIGKAFIAKDVDAALIRKVWAKFI